MKRFVPWLAWLLCTLTSFAAMESRALRKRDIPTLSEALAFWLGCYPRRRHGRFSVVVFAMFWSWLCVHVARWQGAKELPLISR